MERQTDLPRWPGPGEGPVSWILILGAGETSLAKTPREWGSLQENLCLRREVLRALVELRTGPKDLQGVGGLPEATRGKESAPPRKGRRPIDKTHSCCL